MNNELEKFVRQIALESEAFRKHINAQMASVCKQIQAQRAEFKEAAETAFLPIAQQIESLKSFSVRPLLDSLAKSMELLPPKSRDALMVFPLCQYN